MAGNVANLTHTLTKEEQRLGGINSGISRRNNASIRESLIKVLNSGFKLPGKVEDKEIQDFINKLNAVGIKTKDMSIVDLINCGQILGAIGGKADNYRTMLETTGELETENSTPDISINIIDNSNLEKVMYKGDEE